MCNTLNNTIKRKALREDGFSLVELALVFLIVGLVLAPAIHMYHQYRVDKDWTETEENIVSTNVALGGFRNVFGRYPCPASLTAIPGDVDYGHELDDCLANAPAAGNCNNGICTYTNAVSGRDVYVGALPFKTINLQESEAYNSYLGRLRYAVTSNLTSNTLFNMNDGGIGIVDKNDPTESLVLPDSTAHFVVVSHGRNQIGAFSRNGVVGNACNNGSVIEQENCDADAIFTSGDYEENTFDDRVTFFSAVEPSEWQISEPDPTAIALKNTDSVALGANIGQDLSAGDQTMVLQVGADSGTARTSTRFVTERLCEYDAASNADCFQPELIAGSLTLTGPRLEDETTPGSGISCYKPGVGQDEYMTGIANGAILCTDEIFVTCPAGSFIREIDANGNVECSGVPADPCPDDTVTGLCGVPQTVTGTFSGGHSVTYGGECRMITDYDNTYFTTQLGAITNLGDATSLIATLNAEVRTVTACDTSAANSQVRDAWLCTAGTWSSSPVRTHEKFHPWSTYPSNVTSGSSPWPAENSYSGADANNTNFYHDCWCREDYRVDQRTCPGGLAGTQIAIQKHPCPQSSHQWTDVYVTDALCACAPGTTQTNQSCNSYYDEVNGTSGTNGLTGSVIKTFDITCVGGVPTTSTTPSSVDTSACACPARAQVVNRTYCSTGMTNNWTWPGGNETGVETLSTRDWICPGTTTGGLPDPGSWGPTTPYSPIPACSCDNSLTDIEVLACPTGQQGSGLVYEKEWDCTLNGGLGGWEPQTDWSLIANNCKSCSWQAPSGTPSLEDFAYGVAKGSSCSCGESASPFCHDFAGGGKYNVWNGCPCVVQN